MQLNKHSLLVDAYSNDIFTPCTVLYKYTEQSKDSKAPQKGLMNIPRSLFTVASGELFSKAVVKSCLSKNSSIEHHMNSGKHDVSKIRLVKEANNQDIHAVFEQLH